MSARFMGQCKSCGARVRWVELPSGKRMPLDALPSEKGNVEIVEEDTAVLLNGEQIERAKEDGRELFLPHFATCPNASKHRRRG